MLTQTKQERDIELLWQSAEHWLENFQVNPRLIDTSYASCPLCQEYYERLILSNCCLSCPIYHHTGKPTCFGTPYYDVIQFQPHLPYSEKFLKDACAKEYTFLVGLALSLSEQETHSQ